MDVVSALSKYRKSVLEDEMLYILLHVLYLEGETDEMALSNNTAFGKVALKEAIRELHKANFLHISASGAVSLTSFAEGTLSRLGADNCILRFLLDDIVSQDENNSLYVFADWVLNVEPERANAATRSLRNLRAFLSAGDATETERRNLVLLSLCPAWSRTSHILQNEAIFESIFKNYHNSIDVDGEASCNFIVKKYNEALSIAKSADLFCFDVIENHDFSQQISNTVRMYISFKTYNYIKSSDNDYVFERCIDGLDKKSGDFMWHLIWSDTADLWGSTLHETKEKDQNLTDSLVAYLKKQLRNRAESSYKTYEINYLDLSHFHKKGRK